MEVELESVTLRGAIMVANFHAKHLDRKQGLNLQLLESGMVRVTRDANRDIRFFIGAACVESCETTSQAQLEPKVTIVPPPADEPAENREMFERRQRDPKDKLEKLDPEIQALIDGEPLEKKARKKK